LAGRAVTAAAKPGVRTRRQGLWRLVLLMVMIGIAAFYISPIKAYIVRSDQIKSERAATEALRQKHEQLLTEKEKLQQNDYVEQVARRDLGLVRPGEQPFVVKDLNQSNSNVQPAVAADDQQAGAGTAPAATHDSLLTRLLP